MKFQMPFFSRGSKSDADERRKSFEHSCTVLTERLNDIRACFDMAEDDDIIDALVYEENAVLCRLAELYKQARSEGISLEHYERTGR